MKLCWLIPDDRSNGVASVALSCCQQAVEAGHETTLLMLVKSTNWITSRGFRVSSLELSGSAPEAPVKLLQWLQSNPQDVVFFNGCGELEAAIPYLPPNLKCVFVVHDTAPQYWRKALAEEENLEAIIAVSETVASQFRHRLKQPKKLTVISNGCVFPEQPELNAARHNDLIFLGGDSSKKGAFDVLKLWRQLVQCEFTGGLHWFGNVSPSFRAKIDRMPARERIQVYGRVKRELIFSTAASAKVLLMLSRVEPFGMATIEAMSMGCVPVAWDVDTGTKEIVVANQSGLFAPLGDIKVLSERILYACDNYRAFSTAVMERARSNFDRAVMWKGYVSLIERISLLEPIERNKEGQQPTPYKPPIRRFQLLPPSVRSVIRETVGRSPHLGYWLRDLRGW